MGIEPTPSAWKAEVLPLNYTRFQDDIRKHINTDALPYISSSPLIFLEGVGFEPTKAKPSDLQSDPFGRSGTPPQNKACIIYCALNDVNKNCGHDHTSENRHFLP